MIDVHGEESVAFSRSIGMELGHGKKIHCFSGKTFPTLEAGSRFLFFLKLIQWGNPQETTNRNAKVLVM